MGDAAVKESRRVLRLVQDHLSQSHQTLGVQQKSLGLVDVLYHPENSSPLINFVSPRKKTAWVPAPEVKKGLDELRNMGRTPRVYYIEGLFPPGCAKSLHQLELGVEQESPIITYKFTEETKPIAYELERGLNIVQARTHEGISIWWYVWRNAYYDVVTQAIDPVYVGRDIRENYLGNQIDMLLYRFGFPVGVVRTTVFHNTAHIKALAVMREVRTKEMVSLLYKAALKLAQERGCELVFTSGSTEIERAACREIGFVDAGSIVIYGEGNDKSPGDDNGDLEEPVFILR